MALTAMEIIALVVLLVVAIKLIILLLNPKTWLAIVKVIYGNSVITTIVALVLGAITLKYLLKSLTIIQIFAVMAFMGLLILIGAVSYSKEIMTLAKKLLKDRNCLKRAWLAVIIWVALIIWGFYVLFV